jgi:hypothetical protein
VAQLTSTGRQGWPAAHQEGRSRCSQIRIHLFQQRRHFRLRELSVGVDLDHARDIIADLMDTVGLRPTLRLAKFKGDASHSRGECR